MTKDLDGIGLAMFECAAVALAVYSCFSTSTAAYSVANLNLTGHCGVPSESAHGNFSAAAITPVLLAIAVCLKHVHDVGITDDLHALFRYRGRFSLASAAVSGGFYWLTSWYISQL